MPTPGFRQAPLDSEPTGPVLLVFAKFHTPGAVKTRMIPAIGANGAARVQSLMTAATLRRARAWGDSGVVLVADPNADGFDLSGIDWALPQGTGDLGARIRRAHRVVFERYGRPMLTLGTDAPDLPGAMVGQIMAALRAGAAGMCPSSDGGYCAIGVPHPLPELFRDIEWGSTEVAAQTRRAAARHGVRLVETAAWHDIDTLADLSAMMERICTSEEAALRDLHAGLICEKLPGLSGVQTAMPDPTTDPADILIADDNPQILELLEAYLEPLNVRIRTAKDGQEVLDAVSERAPDLILLDIMMPKRSGFEVCQTIKQESGTSIPIIMVTALNEVGDMERASDCGADEYISKPVNKIVLLEKVRSLLGIEAS